jgi:hypothetical protein
MQGTTQTAAARNHANRCCKEPRKPLQGTTQTVARIPLYFVLPPLALGFGGKCLYYPLVQAIHQHHQGALGHAK